MQNRHYWHGKRPSGEKIVEPLGWPKEMTILRFSIIL